jgi:hypothetical protein
MMKNWRLLSNTADRMRLCLKRIPLNDTADTSQTPKPCWLPAKASLGIRMLLPQGI